MVGRARPGRVKPNHHEVPPHLRHVQPTTSGSTPSVVQRIIRRTQRTKRQDKQKEALQAPLPAPPPPVLHAQEAFFPDYLEN